MKRAICSYLICFICVVGTVSVFGQTRESLEAQRVQALEDIEYVDNMLQSTSREKKESVNELNILKSKVSAREKVISGMNQEVSLLSTRISTNTLAIEMMEADLVSLRADYKNAILNYHKLSKRTNNTAYIFAAKDVNQGYKRLQYLRQMSRYRRNESEVISELIETISDIKAELEQDVKSVSSLRQAEMTQANLLRQEQTNQQRMVNSLTSKERELQKELNDKQKVVKEIEAAISKLIEEETRTNRGTELTPEQMLISDSFEGNKGRLPWPVERGVITSKYGKHQHPVLKNVTEDNIGIEITGNGRTMARSIFNGEVSAITAIAGSNMTVIIRHGEYLSVYNNLVNIKVKKGDKVTTKQEIGEVYQDPASNNNAILLFMIFNNQYLNPEQWISK